MAKAKYGWYRDPEKVEKPKISATEKAEVQSKADQLIETVLKPTHIKPPDPGSNFNYIAALNRNLPVWNMLGIIGITFLLCVTQEVG